VALSVARPAYSCGGSHGFGPFWVRRTVFPFTPTARCRPPWNRSRHSYGNRKRSCQLHIAPARLARPPQGNEWELGCLLSLRVQVFASSSYRALSPVASRPLHMAPLRRPAPVARRLSSCEDQDPAIPNSAGAIAISRTVYWSSVARNADRASANGETSLQQPEMVQRLVGRMHSTRSKSVSM